MRSNTKMIPTVGATISSLPELKAAENWKTIDFISDLHLSAAEHTTAKAWQDYLEMTSADAVFILGDLFEVWVGDDVASLPSFEAQCMAALAQATAKRPIFFMHGNRDFLISQQFSAQTHVQLLADPTVLCFSGVRYVLSHGDALCLDDTEYQAFREEVRSLAWQCDFLAKSLDKRSRIARDIRDKSEARKLTSTQAKPNKTFIDLDDSAIRHLLAQAQAQVLIHGHTHQPADHDLGNGDLRIVLSDWSLEASSPRAQVLRLACPLNAKTAHFSRINLI